MEGRDNDADLKVKAFDALDQAERARLSSLTISAEQQEFGGTFQSSMEEWAAADKASLLGLAFFLSAIPVGLVLLKRPPLSPDWVPSDAVSLHALKLADRFQGRGLGRRAFRLALGAAGHRWPDARKMILAVDATNGAALHLYKSSGMRDSGPVYQGRVGWEHRLEIDLPQPS